MNNRMTFRSDAHDLSQSEARKLYNALKNITDMWDWDGESTVQLNMSRIMEARALLQDLSGRRQCIPRSLPDEFVLVCAPSPTDTTFDDWMQKHRAKKKFEERYMHTYPYGDYSTHPVRHLQGFVSKISQGRSAYAYFVPHRTAKGRYEPPNSSMTPPFSLHYDFAYPIFQTIDLHEYEIARGPYSGQRVIELFDEGPGVYLVKRTFYSSSLVQKYRNRRNVVYATWVAHLAPPYGTWRAQCTRVSTS